MTRILKILWYGGMQSSVDEKQYEYAYTLLGPCTSTIAQVCTKKSTLLLPLSSTFSGIWSQAKKLFVFSLVCIVFKSRSLLRRGNPKFDLENLRSSFFRGSVEETTTFNYLEAQKREGKRIVLHTHPSANGKLYRRDLAFRSCSFNQSPKVRESIIRVSIIVIYQSTYTYQVLLRKCCSL